MLDASRFSNINPFSYVVSHTLQLQLTDFKSGIKFAKASRYSLNYIYSNTPHTEEKPVEFTNLKQYKYKYTVYFCCTGVLKYL